MILLIVVLAVAFIARLGFAGFVVGFHADSKADALEYHLLAKHLSSGEGYATQVGKPTGRRPPGLPFVMAAIYRVTGPNQAYGRALQIILGVVVVWLIYLVARNLFGHTVALVAAAFAALNPFLTFISGYVLTENLYMTCLLGAFAFATTPAALLGGPWRRAIGAAVLLGFSALTRPTGLPISFWVGACALLLAGIPWRARIVRLAALAAVVAALVLPWCIRNQQVLGGWAGLTTHGGITFFQGNNPKVVSIPQYRGGVAPLPALPRYEEWSRLGEVEADKFAWRMGKEFVKFRIRELPKMMYWRFKRFWRWHSDANMSGVASGWWWSKDTLFGKLATQLDVGFLYAAVTMPLFLVGIWLTRRRWRDLSFLYGVVLAHTAIGLLFYGSIRGRIPIEPVIAILAGVSLVRIVEWFRARRPAQTPDSEPVPE